MSWIWGILLVALAWLCGCGGKGLFGGNIFRMFDP